MGKKNKKADGDVVAAGPGPLAPWRFSIAILVSAVTTGMTLYRAAASGIDLDMALVRSFGVYFLTWIVLGSINKMLAIAESKDAAAADDVIDAAASDDRRDPAIN
jgi:hypothetical protein